MLKSLLIGGVCVLAVGLTGCSGVREVLGYTKQSPDEFQVYARAPLSLPPDFSLRPPAPGTPRPQEGTARDQAQSAVFGDYTYGTITWYNRTAGVTGQVIDGTTNPDDYTVAIFEAFAGATKIDSESRTANLPAVPDGAAGRFACDIGG